MKSKSLPKMPHFMLKIVQILNIMPEEKDLLLKDLSARLPYSPKVRIDSSYTNAREVMPLNHSMLQDVVIRNFDVIPYLRPMSSMTEEETKEFVAFHCVDLCPIIMDSFLTIENESKMLDWLNAHHFDYRGLIEKGLAIEVTTDNNPYKNENN